MRITIRIDRQDNAFSMEKLISREDLCKAKYPGDLIYASIMEMAKLLSKEAGDK